MKAHQWIPAMVTEGNVHIQKQPAFQYQSWEAIPGEDLHFCAWFAFQGNWVAAVWNRLPN